jgi:hypothetical protein
MSAFITRARRSKEERVSTSIKIRPSLWEEAKVQAIRHKMKVSELVEKAIENWLAKNK